MKLSKYFSYLNDKGSVRKRTNISGKSIPRFIPACRYSNAHKNGKSPLVLEVHYKILFKLHSNP